MLNDGNHNVVCIIVLLNCRHSYIGESDLRSLLRTRGLLSLESSTATAGTAAGTGIIFEVEVLVLLVREVRVVVGIFLFIFLKNQF